MSRLAPTLLLLLALAPVAGAEILKVDGEVYARDSAALLPPTVDGLWQLNITQLASDGAQVRKGEPVLSFDGNELMTRLMSKQSELKEKHTQLEKLQLELDERARDERLATAEAHSKQDKARRKTAQPQAIIAGVQYRKLLVARQLAEQRMALATRREKLTAEQRRQERRLLASEVTQLATEVAELQRSIGSLNIVAPRDGLMMHKSSWNGEKFDVGSQVWRGQSVAEIPDVSSLSVRAELPERDLRRVAVGTPARIVIEGGAGSAMRGKVSHIGTAVRSKSRVQPIPVLDLDITLDASSAQLKPGQAVRVELTVPDTARTLR